MAALVNHPIWRHPAFNALGNPFPPFDFNSGMGVEPLSRAEAEELGLLPPGNKEVQEMMRPENVLRSLNEELEIEPDIRSAMVWDRLLDDLAGFAVRIGDRLVFTDPNGTRRYSAKALAEVITAPLPRGFPNHQADAVAVWSTNSTKILKNPGSDAAHHLARLVERTEPLAPGIPLYRGESFATEGQLLDRVRALVTQRELNSIATSFSKDRALAEKYSQKNGPHRLIIRLEEHSSAKSIEEAMALVNPRKAKEREVLMPHGSRIEIVSLSEVPGGFELIAREVAR